MVPLRPHAGSGEPHVVVVGAGMVGLSVAWFLQEHGVRVSVLDRAGVAGGSSWGNAGWVSPGMAVPLAEPSVLKYGLKALADPDSPLYIPIRADRRLLRFLTGFTRRCTTTQWGRDMKRLIPLNERALETYDQLSSNGVAAQMKRAPIVSVFRDEEEAAPLKHELEMINAGGLQIGSDELRGDEVRRALPLTAPEVGFAIAIQGQGYINPGEYAEALADSVRKRGGEVRAGAELKLLSHGPGGITCLVTGQPPVVADAVVVANGAWLQDFAHTLGIKTVIVGGRGYSFSASVDDPPPATPMYFPIQRVACTPIGDRLRVGGTMEFRDPDEPLYPARARAIMRSVERLLPGVHWDDRIDMWVGARPVTVDNLPLIGPTTSPGVWVAGGHGMWGITQGPITGKLLAEQMMTGHTPEELRPFNPVR